MSDFLLGPCPACGRDVLLAHDLQAGELVTRCLHCDHLVDREVSRPASAGELAEHGYIVDTEASPHGERGCRDGQCGVRQPDR